MRGVERPSIERLFDRGRDIEFGRNNRRCGWGCGAMSFSSSVVSTNTNDRWGTRTRDLVDLLVQAMLQDGTRGRGVGSILRLGEW
jgi:hypothetical protein